MVFGQEIGPNPYSIVLTKIWCHCYIVLDYIVIIFVMIYLDTTFYPAKFCQDRMLPLLKSVQSTLSECSPIAIMAENDTFMARSCKQSLPKIAQ